MKYCFYVFFALSIFCLFLLNGCLNNWICTKKFEDDTDNESVNSEIDRKNILDNSPSIIEDKTDQNEDNSPEKE